MNIDKGVCRSAFFECMLLLSRCWGVFCAIVLCGVGVDLAFHRYPAGYCLIAASIVLLLLEVIWVVSLFLELFYHIDSAILQCWQYVAWVNEWRKTVLYAPLGTFLIIWPHNLWLSYVAGGQILALALFHFITSFQGRKRRKKRHRSTRLFNHDVDTLESSGKFEEVPVTMQGTTSSSNCNITADTFSSSNNHSLADSLVHHHTTPNMLEVL